jgi:hypothetical protein
LELVSNCNELLKLHSEKIDEEYYYNNLDIFSRF